jgi:outer membrane protein
MIGFSKLAVTVCTMGLVGSIASFAMAHEAGDILLRVGAATVFTNTDSGTVSNLPDGVNNATVDVDNNTQLGITAAYMFTDNFGIELLAATPFSHTATGENDIDGVTVGKTKQLPPTLTAQYYFGDKDSTFNPYIGAGFNYTIFFDEETSQDLIGTLNTLPTIAGLGGISSVSMDLDNSFGVAVEAGIDIKVAENWYINAAVWWIDIGTTATLKTDLGTTHKVDVDLDPWVLNVAIAYKF